jgi:predicted nuclease of restriction endonuclease-like RecB superfamily
LFQNPLQKPLTETLLPLELDTFTIKLMLQKRQAIYRVRKGKIHPFRLATNKQNLDIIGQMLECMQDSIGMKKNNIEENLQYFARQIWQPKLSQAVIKLLLDKAVFEKDEEQYAADIREKVFENSQKFWSELKALPNVQEIPEKILGATFRELPNLDDDLLYKDLPANQILLKFEDMGAKDFIGWVDLCMIRALLLQAVSMRILFSGESQHLRVFMRYLKFFGLLFQVKKKENDWEMLIDGPESILENSRNYGINFCNLLPAALLIKGEWEIFAKIQLFEKKDYQLKITPEDGYKSFYKKTSFLRQKKIEDFAGHWDTKNTSVKISQEVFSLKDNIYLLPDLEVTKKKKTYYFEWIQYPLGNVAFLKRKMKLSPKNYIFLVVGSKKKFLNAFGDVLQKKMICFAKNFIQSKIEDYTNGN